MSDLSDARVAKPIVDEDDAENENRVKDLWETLLNHTVADTLEANLSQLLCTFTFLPDFYESFLRLIKFSRYLLNNTIQVRLVSTGRNWKLC
jgi:hypothetical protein